jgi:translation initiation factor 1
MTRLFAGTPFDIPPTCEECGKLQSECECTAAQRREADLRKQKEAARLPPDKQTARVTLQKRKGGRMATVVEGLTDAANDLPELFKQLQLACGTGGTVKTQLDVIELQGDHVERVRERLKEIGYRVK